MQMRDFSQNNTLKDNKRHLKGCLVYILMTEYTFYKIYCNDTNIDYTYIGSTKNLRVRKNQHKCTVINEASKKYNYPLYKYIRENGGWDNWTMSPIGKGIFEKRVDALIEEQKYINNNNNSTLNTHRAFMTKEDSDNHKKQYVINNPEKVKESRKKYDETHKEEIKESQKKYREAHKEKTTCECGGCYTYRHKAEHFRTKRHIDHFLAK